MADDQFERTKLVIGLYETTQGDQHIFSSLTNGNGQPFFGRKFYLNAESDDREFKKKNLYQLSFYELQYVGIPNIKTKAKKIINWSENGFDCIINKKI